MILRVSAMISPNSSHAIVRGGVSWKENASADSAQTKGVLRDQMKETIPDRDCWFAITLSIHVWYIYLHLPLNGIFTYIYHRNQPHV